jgi:hypothetical protein
MQRLDTLIVTRKRLFSKLCRTRNGSSASGISTAIGGITSIERRTKMKAQTNNADRSEQRNPGGPKATPQEDFELTPGQLLGIVGGDARTDPGDDDDKMSGGELAALILLGAGAVAGILWRAAPSSPAGSSALTASQQLRR